MNPEQLNHLTQIAARAAQEAADFIRRHSAEQIAVTHKAGMNSHAAAVVTWVDLQCQNIILQHLNESMQRYDLGLLTEELPDDGSRLSKAYFWCIDPLDGTLAFTQQRPGYAVSIALVNRDGVSMIGVIHDPVTDRRVIAIRGQGVQSDLLTTDDDTSDSNVLWCMLDRGMMQHAEMDSILQGLKIYQDQHALHEIRFIAGAGAALQACRVASHNYALYFKLPKVQAGGGSIWDYAATACVFGELGLHLSDTDGQVLHLNNPITTFMNQSGVVFATDMQLAEAVINRSQQ
ncbi:inositol monophosphatase family protein [Reichenbachiella agarivorans]|uniref:Inositol monophosphatase family protein n=1 Tax=Reichenbachiella agarivorans TaxID=2979464 RepID=A0ABY6CQ26_9BACT|nr:inositol monophosphatase family protein [Reichenbachiella agarivorans]UXP31538.1 inositol monophosphatase family protein [Reichenbachiella agarivorans]